MLGIVGIQSQEGVVHYLLSFFQSRRCGLCLKEWRQRSTVLMVGSLCIFPVTFTFPSISNTGACISLFKRKHTIKGRANM